ncbi:UDP-3-O-acylglucosamine N-acyltransferase [Pseudolycoriella hygida]|uniref:UDP-3-O-acylglucosamine N-acyltransferase n=1 Tax=Pseudolycoriella hygida TaxID=35572 RepID=A0A9Q0S5N9_9DIPT|nr:UDP-3-O-acylglucosamine N-acyltransferase [Pseudolycoriella hygida]
MVAVQIYLLVYLYRSGQITVGSFAFVAATTFNIHEEVGYLLDNIVVSINPKIATVKTSYNFINAISDVIDKKNAKLLPVVKGEIKYENVTFGYDKRHNIFEDLSLTIKAEERVGIVGTSGAGKTSWVKCLLRYFDLQKGRILIDGYDICGVTQESLRSNIAVIPQDITMFHRSILENLQLAKYDATLQDIYDACTQARIHNDIEFMPQGYNTIVGERGVKLSGGQRQRIAIARAILKSAPILILDEATSALDTPTELLIQQSIRGILETTHATTIVIAHRLSTLLSMDRILVFEQGKIIEEGSHPMLLAQNGSYKKLWETQIEGFQELVSLPSYDDILIHDMETLEEAKSGDISFLINNKYLSQLQTTKASCCIVSENISILPNNKIILLKAKNPHFVYTLLVNLFYKPARVYPSEVMSSAYVSDSATIGANCYIGHNVVIEDNVIIGDNAIIEAGTFIGYGVIIGDNALIYSNVSISYSIIGDDVVILPGARIGQDGFGFSTNKGIHNKIFHSGIVKIGNNVEIGSNTTIDRGTSNDTIIGDLCRLDNLVQIGHNVKVGKGSIIVAQAGIAGSTKIGSYCALGGQAGVAGHLTIGDKAQLAAGAGVIQDVEAGSKVGGFPALPIKKWFRQFVILKQLAEKSKSDPQE